MQWCSLSYYGQIRFSILPRLTDPEHVSFLRSSHKLPRCSLAIFKHVLLCFLLCQDEIRVIRLINSNSFLSMKQRMMQTSHGSLTSLNGLELEGFKSAWILNEVLETVTECVSSDTAMHTCFIYQMHYLTWYSGGISCTETFVLW